MHSFPVGVGTTYLLNENSLSEVGRYWGIAFWGGFQLRGPKEEEAMLESLDGIMPRNGADQGGYDDLIYHDDW